MTEELWNGKCASTPDPRSTDCPSAGRRRRRRLLDDAIMTSQFGSVVVRRASRDPGKRIDSVVSLSHRPLTHLPKFPVAAAASNRLSVEKEHLILEVEN